MNLFVKTGLILCLICVVFIPAYGESLQENRGKPRLESSSEPKALTRWGRDPFYRNRPKANTGIRGGAVEEPEDTANAKFFLSAIIFQEGVGMAIINGRIVGLGDRLGQGMVVSRILSNKVFLQKGKQRVELQVKPFGSN